MLIDEDGVGDVVHDDILECEVERLARWGTGPSLDPDSVGRIRKRAVPHVHTENIRLILVLP